MKKLVFILIILPLILRADESVLLQRIVELEKRVAVLEEKLAPVLEEERVKKVAEQQRELARERMILDAEYLSRADLNLVEKAYQQAKKDWKTDESIMILSMLSGRFPRANRTGCAKLARAQSIDGDDQIKLLKETIEKHSSCYYQNGVNVGAYARLYLGMRYKKDGKDKEAAKLFEELRTTFPDAIDHKGKLLSEHLAGID